MRCVGLYWIEPLQLETGIARGELPEDAASLLVPFAFDRLDLPTQYLFAFQASGEGIALQNGNLNFGHIQPGFRASVCSGTRRVAEYDAARAGGKVS